MELAIEYAGLTTSPQPRLGKRLGLTTQNYIHSGQVFVGVLWSFGSLALPFRRRGRRRVRGRARIRRAKVLPDLRAMPTVGSKDG